MFARSPPLRRTIPRHTTPYLSTTMLHNTPHHTTPYHPSSRHTTPHETTPRGLLAQKSIKQGGPLSPVQTEASNAGEFALGLMEEMKQEGVEPDIITYGCGNRGVGFCVCWASPH